MRFATIGLALLLTSGCTALIVGGGTGGGSEWHKSERDAAVKASDTSISSSIKASYDADSTVSMFNIGVRTYKGVVTLTGTVSSYVPRDQAGKIAKATAGVAAVNNQIVVGSR